GVRIQARLKRDARVSAMRAHPREAAATPRPIASTGGPGIFPIPVSVRKPQAVSARPARLVRIPAMRTSRDCSGVPGSGRSRIALLGQHDEDVHDQENAREDSEGAHDQEELRRGATDLDRLCDSARLRILDAEGQMVARDTETEILCDLVRDRDTLHDPADIR